MVAVVFGDSGIRDLKDPESRSKDIGMSKGFTVFLAAAETRFEILNLKFQI